MLRLLVVGFESGVDMDEENLISNDFDRLMQVYFVLFYFDFNIYYMFVDFICILFFLEYFQVLVR